MPYYNYIKYKIRLKSHRRRAVRNLKKLREQLDKEIPQKNPENTFLLATWNIRDFDKKSRRGFGSRLPETLFYIAEIISRFDLVAVQEVNRLGELYDVMDILGDDWDFIASDETDSRIGGNGERLTFIYDKRKVWFQNIAEEIVLSNDMLISSALEETDSRAIHKGKQFRRSPYVCLFQANWFKFAICTVHIYYGAERGAKLEERRAEIERLVDYFSKRADEELEKDRALILLGDFNIVHPDHRTMKALESEDFEVPNALKEPTNISRTKFYDQIAFKAKPGVIEFVEGDGPDGLPNAGVFELFKKIMTAADFQSYESDSKASPNGKEKTGDALKKYYRSWRTYQLSDHNPLWARIHVNASGEYLDHLETEW